MNENSIANLVSKTTERSLIEIIGSMCVSHNTNCLIIPAHTLFKDT